MIGHGTTAAEAGLRRVLLLIVVVGALGLLAELFLLEHFDETLQWVPVVMLTVSTVGAVALWRRPTRAAVRLFRAIMGAAIVAGIVGIWLHFSSNRAFEVEMDASQGGWLLVWHSLRGATPALAPGAMVQLGLIGLLYTWRHPALIREPHREG